MSTTEIARYLSRSQPRLRGYIAKVIYNWADIDDILQDVAVTAVQKADTYDPQRSLDAWIFGIARMKVLQYLDQNKRRRLTLTKETAERLLDDNSLRASHQEMIGRLQQCLSRLRQEDRDLLMKRHRTDMTNRDLAKELGYSESKTSRIVTSLYQQLMRCLKQKLDE